ncbi:sporulation histidine kinase inhibitor Sda [Cohnella sp. 56]|uniref:sporulation histidine kinase inhibitor Sda n=1 Tax=Cohnella sp. 56 TaxID=3113722 RepID=UPI0030E9D6CF
MNTVKQLKEGNEALYVSLALQTVLHENASALDVKHTEVLNLAHKIQEEIERFHEAAHALRTPSGKVVPQMRFILAHLQDEHLASSYFEARSLGLDADFVHMLRTEIIRRGITDLYCEDLEH